MSHEEEVGITTEVGLRRDLSLFDITMIGVGAMIGAGIFVLTGEAAGIAGPALILSFALNGVVTIFTAMVYAELGSAIPEAGGGYLWVKEGLPGANAFLAGWMSWFAHAVAGALYALGHLHPGNAPILTPAAAALHTLAPRRVAEGTAYATLAARLDGPSPRRDAHRWDGDQRIRPVPTGAGAVISFAKLAG